MSLHSIVPLELDRADSHTFAKISGVENQLPGDGRDEGAKTESESRIDAILTGELLAVLFLQYLDVPDILSFRQVCTLPPWGD